VASALLALAEHTGASGRALIDALVLGVDVSCRMGNLVYPEHYDRGWHITGSTGVLGAAAGCARLLGLDAQRTAMAIGIAASQPVGLREQFGTMAKPLHPGAAARVGLMAALMAGHGFTASSRSLEAPRGWAQVVSTKCDWAEATDQLGERFEIAFNTYKPYACGIVVHPAIEACAQLRERGIAAAQVERIELKVHPLVLELCGRKDPADGLQAKFSVYHGCAAGLIFGRAGEAEFADAVATREDVVALRRKVVASVGEGIAEDAVALLAVLSDGRRVSVDIEHATGSATRPLSDSALEAKFHALADPVLGAARAAQVVAACGGVADAADVRALVALTQP
jgi:2-methylcitrate dehydratase PrpD